MKSAVPWQFGKLNNKTRAAILSPPNWTVELKIKELDEWGLSSNSKLYLAWDKNQNGPGIQFAGASGSPRAQSDGKAPFCWNLSVVWPSPLPCGPMFANSLRFKSLGPI